MSASDRDFTIAALETFHVALGGKGYWEGYRGLGPEAESRFMFSPGWRTVYPRRVEAALCKVMLDDGTIGWGEANAPIAPEVTCLIARNLLAEIVRGRAFDDPPAMWDLLYDAQRGRGHQGSYYLDAIAMVDIAVWDALARRAGLPLARLLADSPRAVIPAYLSGIRRPTREDRIAHARDWAGRGITGIKLFFDGDIEAGSTELAALQAAVPEVRRWMVDVLWSLPDLETAAHAKAVYGELAVEWLECPMIPEDLAGHLHLQRRPGAPIALGEHVHTRFDSGPWLEQRALDVFQPDVGRTGISDALRQIGLARDAGIAVTPHMGSGLDVFQAATLHVAAVCADSHLCEFQAGLAGRVPDAITTTWRFEGGAFHLPDAPGIGIEVDEAALAAHVVPPG